LVLHTCCLIGLRLASGLRLLLRWGVVLLLPLLLLLLLLVLYTGPAGVPAQQQLSHYASDRIAVAVAGKQEVIQKACVEHCTTADDHQAAGSWARTQALRGQLSCNGSPCMYLNGPAGIG
jgi:hypothetical protein